jgi:DNA repair protein RecO (recombination protein O)
MSILKTSAIPLYYTDVSNTSRIVTWLTADYGKLSTIIKGEQRKNSLFRGQYDLFSTSELVFYDRTERGMHIAKECSMLHRRPAFRTDWRACAGAGYISALFAKTSLRHGHEPERFELFEEMLSYAEEYGRHPAFLIWFDLRFAEFMGHGLQLEEQGSENRGQESQNRNQKNKGLKAAYRFAADHGGLVDPGYASKHRIPATPLAPEAVDLLKAWQRAGSPEEVLGTAFNPAYLPQIERVLGKFAEYHYDLPPHVRQTAAATLRAA